MVPELDSLASFALVLVRMDDQEEFSQNRRAVAEAGHRGDYSSPLTREPNIVAEALKHSEQADAHDEKSKRRVLQCSRRYSF